MPAPRKAGTHARRLYDLGNTPEQVRLAYRFVDWLLGLPESLNTQFTQALCIFAEERQMTYITSIEEIGIEKGRIEGLREGIILALELKFGDTAQPIIAEIREINDLGMIEQIMARIKTAPTLGDVRRIYTFSTNGN